MKIIIIILFAALFAGCGSIKGDIEQPDLMPNPFMGHTPTPYDYVNPYPTYGK